MHVVIEFSIVFHIYLFNHSDTGEFFDNLVSNYIYSHFRKAGLALVCMSGLWWRRKAKLVRLLSCVLSGLYWRNRVYLMLFLINSLNYYFHSFIHSFLSFLFYCRVLKFDGVCRCWLATTECDTLCRVKGDLAFPGSFYKWQSLDQVNTHHPQSIHVYTNSISSLQMLNTIIFPL